MPAPCTEDTATLALSVDMGASPPALYGDVQISVDDGNTISAHGDGLYSSGGAPVLSVLPVAPADGDQIIYKVDAGHYWGFVWDDGSGVWVFTGGNALHDEVATQESRASVAYGDLATVGPAVTLPSLTGEYLVKIGCTAIADVNPSVARMSVMFGGVAAGDPDSIRNAVNAGESISRELSKAGLAGGIVLTTKYKSEASGTSFFDHRWISVTPVTVS